MKPRLPLLGFMVRRHVPVLLQSEASECALACLAMVSSYWGQQIDVATLRRQHPVSLKGATLKSVIELASVLGLNSRPLKLDLAQLGELALPAVLHWDMNHFVVLTKVDRRGAMIHDPVHGAMRLHPGQLSIHFTGVALELSPGQGFKPQQLAAPYTLMSLMGRIHGLTRGLVHLLLLGLAMQIFALALPQYLQWLVDEALVAGDRDLIKVLGLGFLLLVTTQAAVGAVRSWLTTRLSTSINFQWLGNVFAHLLELPLEYFDKRQVGDVVSRFGSIQAIQRALTTQVVDTVIDGILVILTLVMMFLYHRTLALVACAAVLLYLLLRVALFHRLRAATLEQIVHQARQSSYFLSSVRGVQTIRLFSRTSERRHGWMNQLADQYNAELRIARITLTYQSASALILSIERIAVVWIAALAVLDLDFTIGMLFAFLSYQDQFSQRTTALIDRLLDLRMLRLHGERVADIVFSAAEVQGPAEHSEITTVDASISCHALSFAYTPSEPPILDKLSLHIPAGQCVAITGASGCGKTTLARLLLGLLQAQSGHIEIGGIGLTQLGVGAVRQMVGTVMQDDALFPGSIAENIDFFSTTPDLELVRRCAARAGLDDEIARMPMSFNTLVGDMGQGLSGGQKQRLLLARALYKRPRILILDEATSHLDVHSEQLVSRAIRDLDMTRIVIAHRPETIAMADRVIVLHAGAVAADMVNSHPSTGDAVPAN